MLRGNLMIFFSFCTTEDYQQTLHNFFCQITTGSISLPLAHRSSLLSFTRKTNSVMLKPSRKIGSLLKQSFFVLILTTAQKNFFRNKFLALSWRPNLPKNKKVQYSVEFFKHLGCITLLLKDLKWNLNFHHHLHCTVVAVSSFMLFQKPSLKIGLVNKAFLFWYWQRLKFFFF